MTDLRCTRCDVELFDDAHRDDLTDEPFCDEHCSCSTSSDLLLLDGSDEPVGMLPAGSPSVDGALPLGAGSTAGGADAAHDAAHAPAVGDSR